MEPRELTVSKEDGRISILWSDEHSAVYDPFNLRSACPCAMCKGEPGVFGKYYIATQIDTRKDVRAEEITSVGRYGLKISWNDGHNLGIYTFEYLRSLCECDKCGKK
ncbi:MAG: gamma-butyrobetaine hydroxylase-like domain-containing protein [Nitrososphaerales archaeon]